MLLPLSGSSNLTLHFPCVCCSAEGETFTSLKKAVARGIECGFGFTVFDADKRVVSWDEITGLTVHGAPSRSMAKRIRHGLEG